MQDDDPSERIDLDSRYAHLRAQAEDLLKEHKELTDTELVWIRSVMRADQGPAMYNMLHGLTTVDQWVTGIISDVQRRFASADISALEPLAHSPSFPSASSSTDLAVLSLSYSGGASVLQNELSSLSTLLGQRKIDAGFQCDDVESFFKEIEVDESLMGVMLGVLRCGQDEKTPSHSQLEMAHFLLLFRSVFTVRQVFNAICKIFYDYHSQPECAESLLKFVRSWVSKYFEDFHGDEMCLRSLGLMLKLGHELSTSVRAELEGIYKLVSAQQVSWDDWRTRAAWSPNLIQWLGRDFPKTVSFDENLLGFSFISRKYTPQQIAEQLTLLDVECFFQLHMIEFTDQNWVKNNAEINSPNIVFLGKQFDRLSFMVASTILRRADKDLRIETYKKWVSVADFCYSLQNFWSTFAILNGLNVQPIYRLKHLRHVYPFEKKKMRNHEQLKKFCSSDANYAEYREKLKDVLKDLKNKKPYIPALFVHLKDIFMLQQQFAHSFGVSLFDGSPKSQKLCVRMYQEIDQLLGCKKRFDEYRNSLKCEGQLMQEICSELSIPISEEELLFRSKELEEKMSMDEWRRKIALQDLEETGFV